MEPMARQLLARRIALHVAIDASLAVARDEADLPVIGQGMLPL
jgi:hypothetical protein